MLGAKKDSAGLTPASSQAQKTQHCHYCQGKKFLNKVILWTSLPDFACLELHFLYFGLFNWNKE